MYKLHWRIYIHEHTPYTIESTKQSSNDVVVQHGILARAHTHRKQIEAATAAVNDGASADAFDCENGGCVGVFGLRELARVFVCMSLTV